MWRSVCGEIRRAAREEHRPEAFATVTRRRCSIPERVSGLPTRLWKTGASGLQSMRASQARSCLAVRFQSGTTRSLPALAVEVKRGRAVQEQDGDAQADELGDAGAAVVEHGEQDGVALTAPGSAVGRLEQRVDFLA